MTSKKTSKLEKESRSRFRSNIRKYYLFEFIHGMHFISAILIPFFTIWGGITFFQVMILQAIFTVSIFLLEVPTGSIADKFGRKTSIVLGCFISSLGALIYASYAHFAIFVLAEMTFALGIALISGANQSLVYDSLKELKEEHRSKKIFGINRSIHLAALMVGAIVGGLLAEWVGLRATFALFAAPLALSGFIALTFKEPSNGNGKDKKYLETLKKGFSYFKNHKVLRIMAIDYAIIGALAFFLIWAYQVVLTDLGVDIGYFGFVHAALVIVQIGVMNSFGFFEKLSRGKRKYILNSGLLTGIGFISLATAVFFGFIYLAIASMLLTAAFGLTRKTLFNSYMNKHIDSDLRATVLSSVSMFYSGAQTLSNMIFGFLVDINLVATLTIIGTIVIAFSIFSKIEEDHLKD